MQYVDFEKPPALNASSWWTEVAQPDQRSAFIAAAKQRDADLIRDPVWRRQLVKAYPPEPPS